MSACVGQIANRRLIGLSVMICICFFTRALERKKEKETAVTYTKTTADHHHPFSKVNI
jgi:hypothetical protein